MTWKPITLLKVDVRGVNKEHSGLLDVRLPLSARPPREWAHFFDSPVGISISMGMHRPKLLGAEIAIRPPDNELEEYVRHVDERIQAANSRYEQEVLPALMAQEEQRESEASAEAKRLEAARALAKKLKS